MTSSNDAGAHGKDRYYVVYINVETGEAEKYEYNSGLGGIG